MSLEAWPSRERRQQERKAKQDEIERYPGGLKKRKGESVSGRRSVIDTRVRLCQEVQRIQEWVGLERKGLERRPEVIAANYPAKLAPEVCKAM